MAWRKSSRSSDSFNCVEMAFVKSTRSGPAGGECVEAAVCRCDSPVIYVRDSKDPDGPVLSFGEESWRAFIDGAKAGEFDLG